MKIAVHGDYDVAIVRDGRVVDVSETIDPRWRNTRYVMNHVIEDFDTYRPRFESVDGEGVEISSVSLKAPSPWPANLIAAPLNYAAHIEEMSNSRHRGAMYVAGSPLDIGFFLKSVSSICGAGDAIELPPLEGRDFHHEAEMGVIIGRETRGASVENALESVFGYTCLMDITLRNIKDVKTSERVMRKSYETFTPMGPWVVTADEIGDVADLDIGLTVDGEQRQSANTAQLIASVPDLIEIASNVMTLYPGDVIATGTPEGVGPVVDGNEVTLSVENIGDLTMRVKTRAW